MRSIFAAAALFAGTLMPFVGLALASPPPATAPPDWIAGNWLRCEDGARISETWSGAGTGLLVGHGLTLGPSGASFEFLRIAPRDGSADSPYAYFASPGGGAPVAFDLVSSGPERAVFENPAHDFPQRIVYERQGDTLSARIELLDGGNAMGWTYQRAALEATCPAREP